MSSEVKETLEGRERILREAERLFVQHGYRGVSIRDIAQACGMTNAALYYHFSSKEDLFLNMLRHSLQRMGKVLAQSIQEGATCREKIEQLVTAYIKLAMEQKSMFHQGARDIIDLAEPVHKIWLEARDWIIGFISDILCNGQATGEVRANIEVRGASFALMGLANSLLMYQNFLREEGVDPQKVHTIVSIFFEGVGNDSGTMNDERSET
ncbi:MAG: TetR/AcrR family transcriptional regulator [Chloroflexi bacterium]|nr:TetR/AcrR family transcriptional regulator [Chloroflexota bacterium]